MSSSLKAAAVRLCNDPVSTEEHILAAETQVRAAAEQGAQLIVLPEVFNTGYAYTEQNYLRAETPDGPTVSWMKQLAAELDVHLAGSLLLLGPEHITNSLVLVAPDGRLWRYDKNHPWVWERAYFREGHDITVAKTDIGTFGLMICADVFSPRLFERYAGKVDALVSSASPPRMDNLAYHFPDGTHVLQRDLAPVPPRLLETAEEYFGGRVRGLAGWLGVPIIQAVPYGNFKTHLPAPRLSLGVLLALKPGLWRHWLQAPKVVAHAPYFNENMIAGRDGTLLARYDDLADGFALAEIDLPDVPARPSKPPPDWKVEAQAYQWVMEALSWLLIPTYRRGVRRAWGHEMAPLDRSTQVWQLTVAAAALIGLLVGRFSRRR